MKTKHIFYSMVLPALFAACTAEEVVENSNVNLEGRTLLNPITFTVDGNVDSRLIWDNTGNGNWKWGEEGDMFSAFLVNTGVGANGAQTDVLDKLLTNYVYSSEDGIHYNTTSAMTEGTYWFYAPGDENKRDNALIEFELPAAQPAGHYKSRAAQVFFTPLYQLAKDDAPEALGLELTNWFGRAVMPIQNKSGKAISVKQVLLTLENGAKWVRAGKISPDKLETEKLTYAFVDGEKVSVYNTDNVTTNDETLAELKTRLQTASDLVYDDDSKVETETLVLNLGTSGVNIANGGKYTFTMLVPATEDGVSCTIKLVTSEGIVDINAYDASNYTKTGKQFKHNGIMPMFGQQADGSFKYFNVTNDNLTAEDNTYYVAEYNYMMQLINTVNGKFSVYNIGDWVIDSRMANAIKNSDSDVTFMQPMKITDAAKTVELTKVHFESDVTVTEGTTVLFGNKVSATNAVNKVVVEEGATATVGDLGKDANATAYSIYKIENAGTLNINREVEDEPLQIAEVSYIETTGALTLVGENDVEVTVKAGTVNYNNVTGATANINHYANLLTIDPTADDDDEDVAVTIGSYVQWNVTSTTNIPDEVGFENNGTIVLDGGMLTVNGELTNNEEIKTLAGNTLRIYGSAENATDATISCAIKLFADATLTNYGIMSNASNTNNGEITAKEGSSTTVGVGSGIIDNSELAEVIANTGQTVKYIFDEACDSENLMALDAEKYSINKLVFKAKLTLNKEWDSTLLAAGQILRGVDVLEFSTGSSLYVNLNSATALPINVDEIIISDDVKFDGFNGYANLEMQKDYTLHVCKNKTLTVTSKVIISNATSVSTVTFEDETSELEAGDVKGKLVGTIAGI